MRELFDYEKVLVGACEKINIELNEEKLEQFKHYYELLVEWNSKFNLTAITEKNEVYLKHFADCVYACSLIKPNATLCDIGTGAGFPAMVIKIVRPDIKILLVDALEKRIKFLDEVIKQLDLKDVETLHARAEDKIFKDKYLNHFDVVTSRAVARMCTLSEYCLPYVKVGGTLIAYKSDKIQDELKESKKVIQILGGINQDLVKYELDKETTRSLVIIKKVKTTDKKYPRDKNRPKTQPIL